MTLQHLRLVRVQALRKVQARLVDQNVHPTSPNRGQALQPITWGLIFHAIGYFAHRAAGMLQRRTHAADLAAIEKLQQEEIEATLTQDPKGLADLWAEDGVLITPGNPPTVGKAAISAERFFPVSSDARN